MNVDLHHKVSAQHLKRSAYLYIRQSTLRQVAQNTESTRRQYDLRQRAVALGWGEEQIVVVDSDQGQSGSAAADRIGFQKLVSEVGMGHAGLVMGLEVSRLARALFTTYLSAGSALGTVKAFRKEKILFPRRAPARGPRSESPVTWRVLDLSTVLRVLKNPRYSGIYCYGRTRLSRNPEGRSVLRQRAAEDWHAWIPDAHAGYISQQEYEENLRRLAENARSIGADRRSPPREGAALLQSIVLCGKCGQPMGVCYHGFTPIDGNRRRPLTVICCEIRHGLPIRRLSGAPGEEGDALKTGSL